MQSNVHYIFTFACAVLAAFTNPATAAPWDLDLSFNPSVNNRISSVAVQADGKILIAGAFTEAGGMARSHLARLHADGTLDQSFNPKVGPSNVDVPISTMAVQPDGKILIGGQFTMVNDMMRTSSIARLNADGALDLSFNPAVDGFPFLYIGSIVMQPDGKILTGGDFTRVNGVARNSFARLNADGSLDIDFRPLVGTSSEPAWVYDTALQPDGKILVYGRLFKIDGTYRHYLARLNSDGTLDPGFNVDTDYEVEVLALQMDGKILIGSDFSTVARLLGQPAKAVSVCCVSVADNLPGFDITSSNARTVVVEGSTNLVNWSAIQTIPVGNVPVRFSDPDHTNFSSRFYRVSWQP